jgi:hypothetical protein
MVTGHEMYGQSLTAQRLVLVLHFLAVDIGRKKAARDNGN